MLVDVNWFLVYCVAMFEPHRHLMAIILTHSRFVVPWLLPSVQELLGYDRPSPKLLSFLSKHYGLRKYKAWMGSRWMSLGD